MGAEPPFAEGHFDDINDRVGDRTVSYQSSRERR